MIKKRESSANVQTKDKDGLQSEDINIGGFQINGSDNAYEESNLVVSDSNFNHALPINSQGVDSSYLSTVMNPKSSAMKKVAMDTMNTLKLEQSPVDIRGKNES